MAASVSGKIAFITGGASGIGAALTTNLVAQVDAIKEPQ
jgi:NAD(P)-dependent dehydrogenase (short-subunit alcohol dehydrogenase family)